MKSKFLSKITIGCCLLIATGLVGCGEQEPTISVEDQIAATDVVIASTKAAEVTQITQIAQQVESTRQAKDAETTANAQATLDAIPTNTSTPTLTPTPLPVGGGGVIAYSMNGIGNPTINWHIFLIAPNTGNTFQVSDTSITDDRYPAWPPDGAKLAYAYREGNNSTRRNIGVMNIDGSGREEVYFNDFVSSSSPNWLSNETLYFIADHCPNGGCNSLEWPFEIFRRNLSSSINDAITDFGGRIYSLDISPQNNLIVATHSTTIKGNPSIYIFDLGGEKMSKLITLYNPGGELEWSPNGEYIVYSLRTGGDYEIFLISSDGGEPIQITDNNSDEVSPTWSPDGSLIAFASNRDGNYEIYLMNADGSEQTRLTFTDYDERMLDWSPSHVTLP